MASKFHESLTIQLFLDQSKSEYRTTDNMSVKLRWVSIHIKRWEKGRMTIGSLEGSQTYCLYKEHTWVKILLHIKLVYKYNPLSLQI